MHVGNYIEVGRVTGSEQLFVDGNVPKQFSIRLCDVRSTSEHRWIPTYGIGLSRSALSIPPTESLNTTMSEYQPHVDTSEWVGLLHARTSPILPIRHIE